MELKEIHTPVFDFSITKKENDEYYYCFKYKGKIIEDFISEYSNLDPTVDIKDDPETFLDFDAAHYPDYIKFCIEFEPELIHETLGLMNVCKNEKNIELQFLISLDEHALTMKENPFRVMKSFYNKVKEAGMKTSGKITCSESVLWGFIKMEVDKGNLADHYRRGLKIMEEAMDKSFEEAGIEGELDY